MHKSGQSSLGGPAIAAHEVVPSTTPKPSPKNAPAAEPTYGAGGALDYQSYLKIPELLRLQTPRSRPPHHDELLFIVIHQAYELWFKLLLHEIDVTIRYLRDDNVARARHFAARIVEIFQLLIRQIHLLETMQPIEFLHFRDHLKPASGFQSLQFRELEFLLGLKEPAYLRFFDAAPEMRQRLEARLREPDLGTAFLEAMQRRGLKIPGRLITSARADSESAREIAIGLRPIYEKPEDNFTLYQLCEKLVEIDESFHLWRHHHVTVVERIIGGKIGTGGSSGVTYLRTTTSKRSFPYLWEVRTLLELPPADAQRT